MYSATVTGEACGRGSPREMVMRAVEECAAEMRAEGAKRGCCRTRLDGGWGCMVQVAGDREGIMRDRGC
ncbi:hypothetical protein BDV25DRAFT_147075 [Aspergillus avenaceus]|uniref:Uncharacterized protein n=1 Tax=Aspergillus avenaceus TaxID=36643 RepID=A0A5N6U897_ASPAV|nr:hypothetical protein BDV25DRAFT_147075 [Aspergillus avenaceus]